MNTPDGALKPLRIPRALWQRDDVRAALRERNIQALFLLLRQYAGASQTRIGMAVGMAQSHVSAIMRGVREVTDLATFERIADGLCIPNESRTSLGLAPRRPGETYVESRAARPETSQPPQYLAVVGPSEVGIDSASRLYSSELDNVLMLANASRSSPAMINALESSITDFWRRDDQYGGETLRPAVTAQLRYVLDLLTGCRTESHRRRLQAVAAELARLTGWMLFDAREFSTGRTYFEEALRLARDIDDRQFIANVLASLSLQATYEDKPNDALALTRAAQDVCRVGATPRVKSMLAMREAFAHATLGDATTCHASLADSGRNLEKAGVYDDDPDWITYFDETKLTADTGIALSRLGNAHDATPFIEHGLQQQDAANTRTRAFHSFWLATTRLHAGDLDEACDTGHGALELASSVNSARIARHLNDLRTQLAAYPTEPAARKLQQRIGDVLQNGRV